MLLGKTIPVIVEFLKVKAGIVFAGAESTMFPEIISPLRYRRSA